MKDKFLIHKAIEFATVKHNGQYRKGTEIPYIVHPIEVMQILSAANCSDEMIVAGILHDTIEDAGATISEIREAFGDRVTSLVAEESEDKSKSWEERKTVTIEALKKCDEEHALCVLADKLSNATSMAYDFLKVGNELWKRFNRPYEKQKWYYMGILEATQRFSDSPIWQKYAEICGLLFKE